MPEDEQEALQQYFYAVCSEEQGVETLYRICDSIEEARLWMGCYVLYTIFGKVPPGELTQIIQGLHAMLDKPEEDIAVKVQDRDYYVRIISLEEMRSLL